MADQSTGENIIVVTSLVESNNNIYLFPKADRDRVRRYMGFSNVHTMFYSMSEGVAVQPPKETGNFLTHFSFRKIGHRPPLHDLSFFREQLSTRWLGRSESSIDEDIREIEDLLRDLKHLRLTTRYPPPAPGT